MCDRMHRLGLCGFVFQDCGVVCMHVALNNLAKGSSWLHRQDLRYQNATKLKAERNEMESMCLIQELNPG